MEVSIMAGKANKTPDYTRRAIDKYNSDHERMQLTFRKGEKDLMKSVGMDTKEIVRIIRAEYEKRAQKA
jgi:hypothetical protein